MFTHQRHQCEIIYIFSFYITSNAIAVAFKLLTCCLSKYSHHWHHFTLNLGKGSNDCDDNSTHNSLRRSPITIRSQSYVFVYSFLLAVYQNLLVVTTRVILNIYLQQLSSISYAAKVNSGRLNTYLMHLRY